MKSSCILLSAAAIEKGLVCPFRGQFVHNLEYEKALARFGIGFDSNPMAATSMRVPDVVNKTMLHRRCEELQNRRAGSKRRLNVVKGLMDQKVARSLLRILKKKSNLTGTSGASNVSPATIEEQVSDAIARTRRRLRLSLRGEALVKSQVEIAASHETKVHQQAELTTDQRAVISLGLLGYNLFVGGNAGTGKSFAVRRLVASLRGKGLVVAVTATTGIAAINIHGSTLHSVLNISPQPSAQLDNAFLRFIDVLVIDEVSMIPAPLLDRIDHSAQVARRSTLPFGGIQVILSGDFLQLLSPCGGLPAFLAKCFKKHVMPVSLIEPMRQLGDPSFYAALNELRLGDGIPSAILERSCDPVAGTKGGHVSPDAIRLFPTRREAKAFNAMKLHSIKSQAHRFAPVFMIEDPQAGDGAAAKTTHETKNEKRWSNPIVVIARSSSAATTREEFTQTIASIAKVPCAHVAIMAHQPVTLGASKSHATPKPWYEKVRLLPATMRLSGHVPIHEHNQLRQRTATTSTDPCTRYVLKILQPSRTSATPPPSPAEYQKSLIDLLRVNPSLLAVRKQGRKNFSSDRYSKITTANALSHVGRKVFSDAVHSDVSLEAKVLKVGCRVMLLRNFSSTLVNGSLGTVLSFVSLSRERKIFPKGMRRNLLFDAFAMAGSKFGFVPLVKFDNGETCVVPYINIPVPLDSSDLPRSTRASNLGTGEPAAGEGNLLKKETGNTSSRGNSGIAEEDAARTACVVTMPLMPAYAFTVHKVQGLTLTSNVVMDCQKLWPCAHLLYVAASRVQKLEHLHFLHLKPEHLVVNDRAKEFSGSIAAASQITDDVKQAMPKAAWAQ